MCKIFYSLGYKYIYIYILFTCCIVCVWDKWYDLVIWVAVGRTNYSLLVWSYVTPIQSDNWLKSEQLLTCSVKFTELFRVITEGWKQNIQMMRRPFIISTDYIVYGTFNSFSYASQYISRWVSTSLSVHL